MKALLHDIADQMHHCAALMSDPHTMRNRSETVANQITLTAKRIEQLKVYLQRPADLPSDKHWFDKSIVELVVPIGVVTELDKKDKLIPTARF